LIFSWTGYRRTVPTAHTTSESDIFSDLLISPARATADALAKLDMRARVADAWAKLQVPLRLVDKPPVWILVRPTAVQIAPVRFDDAHSVILGVVISANTSARIPAGANEVLPATLLPDAVVGAGLAHEYRLVLPVDVSIDALRDTIKKTWDGHTFVGGGTSITVSAIEVYGSGDRIVVGFDFVARNLVHLKSAKGRIYASAGVAYDIRSGNLGLTNVQYDLDTHDRLVALGEWVLRPRLLAEVEARGRVNIEGGLEDARARANAWLRGFQPPQGLDLKLTVDELALEQFRLDNGSGFFWVTARGQSSVRVRPK
jgi:hypothetical protein